MRVRLAWPMTERERAVPSTAGTAVVDGPPQGLRIHRPKSGGYRLLDPPRHGVFPRTVVERMRADGEVTAHNPGVKYLHVGPEGNPKLHVQAVETYDALTFHTLDGDYVYVLTHNPTVGDRAYRGSIQES